MTTRDENPESLADSAAFEPGGVRFCDDGGTIVRGPGKGWACTGSVHYGSTEVRCASPIHRANVPGSFLVVDVPSPPRAREQQPDDRTTAEWIADLVKARQAAEAEVERMQGAARLAMSALTAALTTMQRAARLPEGHEDDADLLHETVALLPARIDRLTKERDEARATVARVEALADSWTAGHGPVGPAALRAALAGGVAADAPTSSDGGAGCHAARDGECSWSACPQLRDGEPKATGRHCPIDTSSDGGA